MHTPMSVGLTASLESQCCDFRQAANEGSKSMTGPTHSKRTREPHISIGYHMHTFSAYANVKKASHIGAEVNHCTHAEVSEEFIAARAADLMSSDGVLCARASL